MDLTSKNDSDQQVLSESHIEKQWEAGWVKTHNLSASLATAMAAPSILSSVFSLLCKGGRHHSSTGGSDSRIINCSFLSGCNHFLNDFV